VSRLEQEFTREAIRRVQIMGDKASVRDAIEGLRNAWQKRVEDSGTPSYVTWARDILEGLVKSEQLEKGAKGQLRRRDFPAVHVSGWISFAWTTPALLAGHKTVTRRTWTPEYAKRFKRGDYVHAYDRRPSWGGKKVALLRLTQSPYRQNSTKISRVDWHAEGFEYLSGIKAKVNKKTPQEFWDSWHTPPGENLWVVRFEVVEVL
jgi:hypothetical protein